MSFPRYPKYKASRVEWLREVPEWWEVKRLKHNVSLLTQKTDRRDHPIGLENIEGWSGNFIPTETAFEGDGIAFDAGDILFGKLRPYLAKAYLATSAGEAVGDFHVMRPSIGMDGRFVQYQILNREFISIVDGSTFGSKMPRASWEFVGGMPVTRPPLPEQTAIAEFLDRETGKIDELVAEQRRLMELLKEKRQAVISHAVTKGLNPHAPMKPSGIEWLGDVPEGWKVCNLNHALTAIGDIDHYMPESVDRGIPYIMTGDLKEFARDIDFERCKQVSRNNYLELSRKIKSVKGDIIMARYATIGTASYIDVDRELLVSYSCVTIKPNPVKALGLYLFYFFKSFAFIQGIEQQINANTQDNIGNNALKKVKIILPPIEEQLEIVSHVETELAKFDTLTAEAQRAIDLLQERRTALISAAVTGQIDVRKPPKN